MISKGIFNRFISVNTVLLGPSIASGLLFQAVSGLVAAPLINGSFEESPIVGIEDYIVPGSSQLTGWTITGSGSIARIKDNARFGGPDPADGSQQLCFNGGVEGAGIQISQEFDTDPGQFYSVSFRVGRRGTTNGIVGFEARIGDASSGNSLGCIAEFAGANGYNRSVSAFFTANSARSTVTFTDISPDTYNIDALLDDVRLSLAASPELQAALAIELRFDTQIGHIYRLQGCSRIGEQWQNVGDPFAGTGQVMSIYKSAADPDLRLYRLLLESEGGTGDCEQASVSFERAN